MISEHGEPLAITIDFPQVGMELLHGHNDATGARGKAAAPIGLRQGQVTLETFPSGKRLQFANWKWPWSLLIYSLKMVMFQFVFCMFTRGYMIVSHPPLQHQKLWWM